MKLYTQEELLRMARPYFEKVDMIYATEDGNFFYNESKNHAYEHSRDNKINVIALFKSDLIKSMETKEVIKPVEEKVTEVIEEAFEEKSDEKITDSVEEKKVIKKKTKK